MPTYAYRCADCEHSFDIYQSFSDEALSVCPECEGQLRKVFGSLGVSFKGSGFYRTDSQSNSGSSSSSSGSSSGSDSSSSTKSTSTPAPSAS
ncbi:FmdB family zinc ribbon protein [Leucobacter denitrificans]|uniref:FmdB family transcriptional regulator n=1 Tax=Leucobacter denitrificans TaxID=683042 RepID=A0A7G9S3X5_9MICO|nr:FmdB family zinc ribbon protein [Leucobacter denitrificans]QNN62550.1 FmdB family transcriptional regulator [Leucobacter denitrificans]